MNTVVGTIESPVRSLRGIPLLKATRALLRHPSRMAERTGLARAAYDQGERGYYYISTCGTTACVAGWMMFLAGKWDGISPFTYHWRDVSDLTGMRSSVADDLYFGRWDRWGEPHRGNKSNMDRSNAAAVRILTRIIAEMEAEAA